MTTLNSKTVTLNDILLAVNTLDRMSGYNGDKFGHGPLHYNQKIELACHQCAWNLLRRFIERVEVE